VGVMLIYVCPVLSHEAEVDSLWLVAATLAYAQVGPCILVLMPRCLLILAFKTVAEHFVPSFYTSL